MKKIILITLFILSIVFTSCANNCDENHACFEKALETCESAKVRTVFGAGERIYEIIGEVDNTCQIKYTSKVFQEVTRTCYVDKNSKFGTYDSFVNHLDLTCES